MSFRKNGLPDWFLWVVWLASVSFIFQHMVSPDTTPSLLVAALVWAVLFGTFLVFILIITITILISIWPRSWRSALGLPIPQKPIRDKRMAALIEEDREWEMQERRKKRKQALQNIIAYPAVLLVFVIFCYLVVSGLQESHNAWKEFDLARLGIIPFRSWIVRLLGGLLLAMASVYIFVRLCSQK